VSPLRPAPGAYGKTAKLESDMETPEDLGAKLLDWCDYLDAGGLDRPIDAIPFDLMRCHDDAVAEHAALVLAVASVAGADTARAVVESFVSGGGPTDVDGDLDESSVAGAVVLASLLSLWAEGMAAPTEPAMTLRKALVTQDGAWEVADDDPPDDASAPE